MPESLCKGKPIIAPFVLLSCFVEKLDFGWRQFSGQGEDYREWGGDIGARCDVIAGVELLRCTLRDDGGYLGRSDWPAAFADVLQSLNVQLSAAIA
jgi:hypothetical protein